MKKGTPRLNTIIVFLKSKGWTVAEPTQRFQVLEPPAWMKFSKPMRYYLPLSEKTLDYEIYIDNLILSISELYDLDYKQLRRLLSQSIEEMEKEAGIRQAILAHAA